MSVGWCQLGLTLTSLTMTSEIPKAAAYPPDQKGPSSPQPHSSFTTFFVGSDVHLPTLAATASTSDA